MWKAIKSCDGNKAPGLDGFNLLFFKKFWWLLKVELLEFFKEFHSNGRLAKGLNSSFIALIPKNDNPVGLGEYRPISLIGSVYKILAKVLAARLKKVISGLIGEVQTAFISGRNIFDGVLVANEIIDWWKKRGKKGVIIKLDFEKAYDSVNWDYLLDLMFKFGFGHKWVGWIRECISTAKLSVLVNGSPTEQFCAGKGLRQGDPLSPFLFIIVAESLNVLFKRARDCGLIKGTKVGNEGPVISHLQFADDTIVFCDSEREEVINVKRILRCFELLSGLKINFYKSTVCGVGIKDEEVKELARALRCKTDVLPMKYLGLPIGASPRRRKTWEPVIHKFKKKLSSWKNKFLSFAGRLTLIKAVLCSLPIYYMSVFKMPESVARELDKIQARFLWGGSDIKKKVHLVSWDKVTLAKQDGGLGVKRLRIMNECLLLKWWWRYGCEANALWKRVVEAKYGSGIMTWNP